MGVLTEKEEDIQDYAMHMRKTLIKNMVNKGLDKIETDEMRIILTALKDMDMSNFKTAQLRIAEGAAQDGANQSKLMALILRAIDPRAETIDAEEVRVIPELPPSEEIESEILPEELEEPKQMGVAEEEYDSEV